MSGLDKMHIAIIPARKESKGLPFKNRMFFSHTADFIDKELWFDKVIVSTDDEMIMKESKVRGYDIHIRSKELAGDAVSIKDVFSCLIEEMNIENGTVLWLFYLPLLYRNHNDYQESKLLIEQSGIKSLCSFVPAKTHPFNCWRYDKKNKSLSRYIENNVFRRQDLPPAWMHHHYLCCFKAEELNNLNNELINSKTHPFLLNRGTVEKLIEIDTPQDYDRWKSLVKEEKI